MASHPASILRHTLILSISGHWILPWLDNQRLLDYSTLKRLAGSSVWSQLEWAVELARPEWLPFQPCVLLANELNRWPQTLIGWTRLSIQRSRPLRVYYQKKYMDESCFQKSTEPILVYCLGESTQPCRPTAQSSSRDVPAIRVIPERWDIFRCWAMAIVVDPV